MSCNCEEINRHDLPTTAPPEAGSLGELLRVALPLVISSGSASLMYVIDRVLLTWYSTEAVAAALPAGMLHWTLISLAIGTANYVNTFVAQYEGAGQQRRVGAVLWQGIYFSIVAGLLAMLCIPLATQVFDAFGHDEGVRALEVEYFSVLCCGSLPLLLSTTLACFYSGRGQTRLIMWVNVASAALNIGLDYVLIFGEFGFPRWGIAGAAAATVIAWIFACGLYIGALVRHPERHQYSLGSGWRFDRRLFARLLRFGLPNGFQLFVDIASWAIFIQLIGYLGTEQLAATSLAFNLNTLAFIPLLGVGTAVMTLTGQRIGEGRPELAVRTTWLAFRMSAVYILLFSAIYLLVPHWILLPYGWGGRVDDFRALEGHVVYLLRFVAVYAFFDAMTIVFSSATRGAGDTRFALLFSSISGVLFLLLPTYVAIRLDGQSLTIPWTAVTLFVAVLGFGFLWRFCQGRWKSMRVIENPAALATEEKTA